METVAVVALLAALITLLIKVRRSSNAWAERATLYVYRYAAAAGKMSLDQMITDIALRRGEPLRAVTRLPRLATFHGIGTQLYGHSAEDPDTGSYATTEWLTMVWLPLIPLARYRVVLLGAEHHVLGSSTRWRVIGRLPLRALDWLVGAFAWALLLAGLVSSRHTW